MATEGEIIWQLIKNAGFKQGKFADKIGIARPSLNSIIKGRKPLGKVNQKRIAKGLGLPWGVFLFLIKLDVPLEDFKALQEMAALKNPQIARAIKALLRIDKAQIQEGFPHDSRPLLSMFIDGILKIAETLKT